LDHAERAPAPITVAAKIMGTLHQKIASKFLEKLAKSERADATKVEQLRKLLKESPRPKVDDFVKIFSLPAGGDIK